MNHFAKIVSGVVCEIVPETVEVGGRAIPLSERYSAEYLAQLTPYDPAQAPEVLVPTLSALQASLTASATAKRWEVETGGIALGGMRVATAKADQDRITSVIVNAAAAGVSTVDFKAESGWATLSLAQVQAVASAIALHVQACFSAERTHHAAIAVLSSVEAAQAYDLNQGWPA